MNQEIRRYNAVYWGCGFTGLLLGGPISGVLASLSIYLILKSIIRAEGSGSKSDASRTTIFLSLLGWGVIGSVAMPISWFAANSIGWNFDAVALIQSAGEYKSYQDWSQAEKNQAKREREMRKAQARLKEAERSREIEERRINEEIARKAEEDRLRVEQQDRDARIQQELKEWNDPVKRQEREESHRQHLLSVGCIDDYGQVIRTLFCLNTEAPRQ